MYVESNNSHVKLFAADGRELYAYKVRTPAERENVEGVLEKIAKAANAEAKKAAAKAKAQAPAINPEARAIAKALVDGMQGRTATTVAAGASDLSGQGADLDQQFGLSKPAGGAVTFDPKSGTQTFGRANVPTPVAKSAQQNDKLDAAFGVGKFARDAVQGVTFDPASRTQTFGVGVAAAPERGVGKLDQADLLRLALAAEGN